MQIITTNKLALMSGAEVVKTFAVKTFPRFLVVVAICALTACGGGASKSDQATNTTPPVTPPNIAATTTATLNASGAVVYPVVNNFSAATLAGKTVAVSVPGFGFSQIAFGAGSTMTYTNIVKTGASSGLNNGTWSVNGEALSLKLADNSYLVLTPKAADVINNSLVSSSYTPADQAASKTNATGGSQIFLNANPAAGLTQAADYYAKVAGTLPFSAIKATPATITEAMFVGRTMYFAESQSGYAKFTFNSDHTFSASAAFHTEAAATQDLAPGTTGTWELSGNNLTLHSPSGKSSTFNLADSINPASKGANETDFGWNTLIIDANGTDIGEIFFDSFNGLAQSEAWYQKNKSKTL